MVYDAFDEVTSIGDGAGNLAWMTYDPLGRMVERCWTQNAPTSDQQTCPNPSGTEINETWSYDAANGIGEIAGEASTDQVDTSTTYTYNGASGLLGTPATKQIVIGGKTFSYAYAYDSNNRMYQYTAPSGAMPTTVWNAYGDIAALQDGTGGKTLWQATGRDAEDHLLSAVFGNGTSGVYTYDPQTGRQTGYATDVAVGSSTALQNVTLGCVVLGDTHAKGGVGSFASVAGSVVAAWHRGASFWWAKPARLGVG